MAIEKMNIGEPDQGSQLPFYDVKNGQDRRCSVAQLAAALQGQVSAAGGVVTQYAAPAASGFVVAVSPPTNGASVWLQMAPAAGYAAGTVVLPPRASCIDGQEVLVTSTQPVTTLTITGNGSGVNGAPATLGANGFFRLRFDGVAQSFFRVG